jgi:phosphatidylinositol-3-phosphatase
MKFNHLIGFSITVLVMAFLAGCQHTTSPSVLSNNLQAASSSDGSSATPTPIPVPTTIPKPTPKPTPGPTTAPRPTPIPTPVPIPNPVSGSYSSQHVFVMVLENRSDAEARKYMPYMTSIANQYTVASQAYSPAHGSFLAYLELTTGAAPKNGAAKNGSNPNCNGDGCDDSASAMTYYTNNGGDNVVRELKARGLSWRGYFQTMPSTGYMGYTSGNYVRRHNPFPFLQEVFSSSSEQSNMVPWTSNFASDLSSGNVANYTWIVPDLTHDGHNPGGDTATALTNADDYLKTQLPALLSSSYFQPGGDGVLFITFDESDLSGDNECSATVSSGCGGHIFVAAIGPKVKKSFIYNGQIMQNTILRTTCDLLGLAHCPGDGASVPGLSGIFQ